MNTQVISWQKAVLALALVATVATAGFLSTRAFFSDTEKSAANVFTAGSLNLKVGINAPGSQWPTVEPRDNNNQQLFAIGGLMPGQEGVGELRLLSEGGDAWACVSAEITGNPENTRLSQEQSAGDASAGGNSGELAQYMEIALWEANGLANSDGIVGPNEKETLQVMPLEDFANGDFYTLQDSDFEDNPLTAGNEYRHEFAYCFGTFTNVTDVETNGGTLECSGDVAGMNVAQTDGVELALNFYAEQLENNDQFTCSNLNTVPPVTQTLTQAGNTYFIVDEPAGANHGFNVGLSAADTPDVNGATSVKVELFKDATLLVTNYVTTAQPGTAGVLAAVDNGTGFSTPFRNVLTASNSWNYGPAVDWDNTNEPTKAVITIEHDGGTWIGTLNGFTGNYSAIN